MALVVVALAVISVIDVRFYKIHNVSVLALFGIGLCFAPSLHWWSFVSVLVSLIMASVALEKIYKKQCLGYGDVKFIAVLSLFMGGNELPIFFFFSGVFATLYLYFSKKKMIPFAPFISAGFLVTLLLRHIIV